LKKEAGSESKLRNIIHKTWGRDVEAVKFLWKQKHFEERSWKQKQTWKRLNLYGAGSKKYSTASTSLNKSQVCDTVVKICCFSIGSVLVFQFSKSE